MRYFLVNNDYHLIDLASLSLVKRDGDTLIKIPHSLGENLYGLNFDKIFEFKYFYLGLRSLLKFIKIYKIHKSIDKNLIINEGDILFVYTDNEILNQYIISKFYKHNCKVYMLEDGLASALVYNLKFQKLPLIERFKLQILRYVYNYHFTSIVFENNNYYPVVNDDFITASFFYLKTNITRKVEVKYLKNETQKLSKFNENIAIFLNQDTYNFDQSESSYFEDLNYIFTNIENNFSKIIFKFHPRENNMMKDKIKLHLSNFNNISFIETKESIESLIFNLNPKYAISYYSSSLKSLFFFGLEPIFIYHLLPSISNNSFSIILNEYLFNLNYNFPKTINDICKGYQSGLMIPNDCISINEL